MASIPTMKMAHEEDPADIIRNDIGAENIESVDLLHNLVLVGVYTRPEKTKGGIILASQTKKEDVFQGVIGLVLKVGPGAFVDDGPNKFYGKTVKPGDWVVFRTSDTWKTSINGVICRVLEDAHVKAIVPHPDVVF